MVEVEVSGISVRSIQGYKNPLTGKSTAIIERLACGHEYVDGKFNVSVESLYFIKPVGSIKPADILKSNLVNPVELKIEKCEIYYDNLYKALSYANPSRRKPFGIMDAIMMVCTVVLAVIYPPLVILPVLYFMFR
jgi:hypothetical protein